MNFYINKNTLSSKVHFKMKCLHGKEAVASTTKNGNFWICGQYPKCQFICSEDDSYLYEKAINAFLSSNQPLPRCCVLENFAKFYVVKDPEKKVMGGLFSNVQRKMIGANTSNGEMKL